MTTSTESPSPRRAALRIPDGIVTWPLSLITANGALRSFIGNSNIQNIRSLAHKSISSEEVGRDHADENVNRAQGVPDDRAPVDGASLRSKDVEHGLADQEAPTEYRDRR